MPTWTKPFHDSHYRADPNRPKPYSAELAWLFHFFLFSWPFLSSIQWLWWMCTQASAVQLCSVMWKGYKKGLKKIPPQSMLSIVSPHHLPLFPLSLRTGHTVSPSSLIPSTWHQLVPMSQSQSHTCMHTHTPCPTHSKDLTNPRAAAAKHV